MNQSVIIYEQQNVTMILALLVVAMWVTWGLIEIAAKLTRQEVPFGISLASNMFFWGGWGFFAAIMWRIWT